MIRSLLTGKRERKHDSRRKEPAAAAEVQIVAQVVFLKIMIIWCGDPLRLHQPMVKPGEAGFAAGYQSGRASSASSSRS